MYVASGDALFPTGFQPAAQTVGLVADHYSSYVDFKVLGPVRAHDRDVEVELGGPKQRLVLAMLLAARGASVSTDALIEGVWMESAPATARKTLQGYVHHLRSRISGGLETDKAGYSLQVPDKRVDERRFSTAVEQARPLVASDPLTASDELTAALALWRGRPYADLEGALVLLPEITRLTEARLVALGDRVEADLALGRHETLIGELESLTVDYPLFERFRSQHMVALYRAGRHGEALRAFARTRNLFIEEMGIEPSEQLCELERRILDRDPTLAPVVEEQPTAMRAIRGYELHDQISNDATGTVYRGFQRSVGREVAIRVTGSQLADDPQFIARYESDVARVANLDHPNIVYVQDTWREPGHAYLVMRWVDGERLDTYLSGQRPSNWAALKMIEEIGDALEVAHRGGVVHGDLSARTVIRSATGGVYLTDFVVGRDPGDVADDRAAFVRLAFHLLFGVEPATDGDLCRILAETVSSPELLAVFEHVMAEPASTTVGDVVRAVRRARAGDGVELADEPVPATRTDVRCPYKGLQAFQTSDVADFFGRDDLVERLHGLLTRQRLVAVVGPSGSGKSSIVKAGLLPRLAGDRHPPLVTEMYPGAYPFDSLARALRSVAVVDVAISDQLLADRHGLCRVLDSVFPDDVTDVVLVIDQFEELFAAVASESVRALFLDSIATAVTDPGSRLRVVVTLRADFFDRPLRYAEFGGLVEDGLVPVAMPGEDGLAAAIELPAKAVGIRVDAGLVSEMVRDVADEPGGLPLLQYALTDLFESRDSDTLTVEAYRASGGVLGSLATRAEALYTDMDAAGQRAMQQAFLRMVTVDQDPGYVRRRVTRADLGALEVDRAALDEGLQRFGAHRLLTFDSDPVSRAPTVEVAHESLLREWGRLDRWIEEQRDQLVVRRRLDAAVQEWEESGEDPGYLLRGRRLAQFDGWAASTDMALSSGERAFLQVSRGHDQAQERKTAARRRRVMLAVAVAAALAVVFGSFALIQRNELADEAYAAETARLGSEAGFVVERDRQTALLMAVETYRRDPGPEGLSALERVFVDVGPYLANIGAGVEYQDARWLSEDRLLAVSDDEVHLLDVPSGAVSILPIEVASTAAAGPPAASGILASSPAGVAAVAATDGRLLLVDADGTVDPFPPATDSSAVAISDDGSSVAIGHADGWLEIVDRGSGQVTASVLANPPRTVDVLPLAPGTTVDASVAGGLGGIDGLAFDRSGGQVVSSGGVFLRAWHTGDLRPAGPEIVHVWGDDDFNLVATRPGNFWHDDIDQDVLVVAGDSFVVRWRLSTGDRVSLDSVAADLAGAAPANGGSILLLADDGRLAGRPLGDLGGASGSLTAGAEFVFDTQERTVSQLSVDDGRSRLAVASDDGVVIASLDGTRLLAQAVPIGASDRPTLTGDGETLAAGLVTDGLYDLKAQPPTRRTFDVDVEIAQFAGSPATFELTTVASADVIMWTSNFMELRNGYDLGSGEYLGDFWGPYVPAWSDDGHRVARLQRAGGTKVVESGSDWPGWASPRPMSSGDFDSTGGRVVLVFADGSPATLVDLATGTERPLPEIPGGVVAATFTPGDDRLVAVGGAGSMWVLDTATLELERELEEGGVVVEPVVSPPVFDVDGTILFSAADGAPRLWHFESGRQIGKPLPLQADGRPSAIADDHELRVATPYDGDALIWNLDISEWVELACRAAGRNMTQAEWTTFGPRDTGYRATCPEGEST